MQFCDAIESITGDRVRWERHRDNLLWFHGNESWVYPLSREKALLFGFLTATNTRWLAAKYTLPGFVELEPTDIVLDCGAFVGGFSAAALRKGASVVAVEPSRTNANCLRMNLKQFQVDVHPVGLGSENTRATFLESSTGVDSTFGKMDEGAVRDSYTVDVLTIDELCRRAGISPTFLKVEAEGMESAILTGMQKIRPLKIAVDGSPEGGSDERVAIVNRLQELGYLVRIDRNMVYAQTT